MSQSRQIVSVLKKTVRAQGLTYNDLAKKLGTSEVTVKRLFTGQRLTIERLEKVAAILGLTLTQVMEQAALEAEERGNRLTYEQERRLADDPKLLALFYLVATHLPFEKILKGYQFEKPELTKYLIQLDKLGILELHAEHRYKMNVTVNVRWLEDGPLIREYAELMKTEFMDYPFTEPGELVKLEHGYLSETSHAVFIAGIKRLLTELKQLSDIEEATVKKARRMSLLVAFRPWTFSLVERFKRVE